MSRSIPEMMELNQDQLARLGAEARFDSYWRTWRKNRQSVAFVPLAHIFLARGMADESVAICEEGLAHHPGLVSGRIVFARALMVRGDFARARSVLQGILALVPAHREARRLLMDINTRPNEEEADTSGLRSLPWRTLTMARILADQGHLTEALGICEERLRSRPGDSDALQLAGYLREKISNHA